MNTRRRIILAIAVCALIWLAALFGGGRDSLWDVRVSDLMEVQRGTTLARNAAIFTLIGSRFVLIPLTLIAAVYMVFHRKRRAALFLFMVVGGRFLVELQKLIVDRPRPDVSRHLVAVYSYAFPSGHAANSMITFLALALLLPVRQRNRAIAVGIALALALQVGTSRILLGVHWPTDVIGGWAFGLMWVMTCMYLASARPETETKLPPRPD